MGKKTKIGVLISGGGSNLQAIMDACGTGEISGNIVFVGTDNPAATGLERAKERQIPTLAIDYKDIIRQYNQSPPTFAAPSDFNFSDVRSKQRFFDDSDCETRIEKFLKTRAAAEARLLAAMDPYEVDLLVLAGFMRNLTPYFIDKFSGSEGKHNIMNIHPALLPAFPGLDGYGDTYHFGCKVGGCTVIFIDYGEDSGPIIGQAAFPILETDSLETIQSKGLALEWKLYPECIRWFAEGRIRTVKMTYKGKKGEIVQRTVVKIAQPT